MNIKSSRSPTGEALADVNDLITFFKEVKENPNNYKQEDVVRLVGEIAGKLPIKKEIVKNPF